MQQQDIKQSKTLNQNQEHKQQMTDGQEKGQRRAQLVPLKTSVTIPEWGQITLNPFPNEISKRILTAPQFLKSQQVNKTYHTDYLKQFQFISGSQNLFPILLEVGSDVIYVCSKDCFIVYYLQQTQGIDHIDKTNLKYQKIKLPQMPTCFRVYMDFLYFGLRSGSIIVYNLQSKTTLATSEQFTFPVLQIQILSKDQLLAIDSCGNVKIFSLTLKLVMDRVIKVSISSTDIIQQYRVKKRDKIMKFVKNLPFRKEKQKVQQNDKNLGPQGKEHFEYNSLLKKGQVSKFCILKQNIRAQHQNIQLYSLIYYHKECLKCFTIDQKNTKIGQSIILQNIQGCIGMMELGSGGFTHSNQSHVILVVSIDNIIFYYRQIIVQNIFQFIQIRRQEHTCIVHNGKFISNNLLIFLTQEGIQISNIGNKIQLVHKINYDKFSYIDFFNQEEGFNFDKRLLYANIIKVSTKSNNDCMWSCLEGKRVLIGNIYNWKNYLSLMVDKFQWEKCMKSALMIYKDGITLLGGIPENVEQRNQIMKSMFEKITLTYISYSLKNNQFNLEHSQIIKNAIDFMVRTQSFAYLFTTIYQAVKSYGLESIFFDQLQQYIESGSVKCMTEQVLMKVVAHYTNFQADKDIKPSLTDQLKQIQIPQLLHLKSQTEVELQIHRTQNRRHLQTMIMNFNLNEMEKSLLLSICLNNELYRSLIHICKEQADYITPILKLCGLRLAKVAELNKLLNQKQQLQKQRPQKQRANNIVSNLHSHKIPHIRHQLENLSKIIFYYLHQCLRGHMTQHNNTKAYVQMLQQLLGFIFIPSSLLMILQSSSILSFKVFAFIFGAQVMQYVLQNYNSISIKSCKYVTPSNINANSFSQASSIIEQPKQQTLNRSSSIHKVIDIDTLQKKLNSQLHIPHFHYTSFKNYYLGNAKYIIDNMSPINNGKKIDSNQPSDYNVFNINNLTQQLSIYNKMLTIITHTIVDNYKLHHDTSLNQPVTPLTNCLQVKEKLLINVNEGQQYMLSQKQQSQLFLHNCHKFITYLILSNSFPVRLGWKVLAYQFLLSYPLSFVPAQTSLQIINKAIKQQVNQLNTRIIDSILRQVISLCLNAGVDEYYDTDNMVQQLKYKMLNTLLRIYNDVIDQEAIYLEMLRHQDENINIDIQTNLPVNLNNQSKQQNIIKQQEKRQSKRQEIVPKKQQEIKKQQQKQQETQISMQEILSSVNESSSVYISNQPQNKQALKGKDQSNFDKNSHENKALNTNRQKIDKSKSIFIKNQQIQRSTKIISDNKNSIIEANVDDNKNQNISISNIQKKQKTKIQEKVKKYPRKQTETKKQLLMPTKCYILDQLNRSSELINQLLGSYNQMTRLSVFDYFWTKINMQFNNMVKSNINDTLNFNNVVKSQIINILLQKVTVLLKIDEGRSMHLLTTVCQKLIQYNQINIVQILNIANILRQYSKAEIELLFMQKIIDSYQRLLQPNTTQYYSSINMNLGIISKNIEMLSIRHLQVVVAFKKEQLEHYVLKMNYPLQQAYKVCEQSNNKTAMAYILIKSGRNLEGVLIICDLFIANSREVFRDLAKKIQTVNTAQQIKRMEQQLNKVLETCFNQYSNDTSRGQQMYEKVSQKLFKQLKPKVIQTIPIVKIKELLQYYVDKIIKGIFSQVNPQFFVQKFSQNAKLSGFPTKLYLQAHDLVYERLGFKYQINSFTKQLLRKNQMKLYQKLFNLSSKGFALSLQQQKCQKCQQCLIIKTANSEQGNQDSKSKQGQAPKIIQVSPKTNQKYIVFNCGHMYHASCLEQRLQEERNSPVFKLRKAGSRKYIYIMCLKCRSEQYWQNLIDGQLKTEPDKFCLPQRQRKKSILFQRRNKLVQFDSFDFFKITGEQLMKNNNKLK